MRGEGGMGWDGMRGGIRGWAATEMFWVSSNRVVERVVCKFIHLFVF